MGIKWDAIDFRAKTLTIRHTVGRGKIDGVTQFIFKDRAKSDSGYRTLPLFDFITDLLQKYKEKYAEYERFYGDTYCNNYKDYVCLMENGELMKPGFLSQKFSEILDKNNLRHIRLHDLRHSCGTLLIQNGVPVKDIQIWLGHSNFQTTLRYAHADIENKRISASVISDKLLFETKKEQIIELEL
ncbi:MAG: site-specific integrase [Clostridia bacterium]|nr:site-specific integrase [Clostridia bacterium]